MRSARVFAWVLTPVVALVTVCAFLPSLSGEFLNWDDGVGLVSNEAYRGLGWTQLKWMFTNVRLGHYMPLTWLTFGINYVAGGMYPWGYHLVNVLLHGANAALMFLIAIHVFRAVEAAGGTPVGSLDPAGRNHGGHLAAIAAGAALAALTFGLHPQRVEPVAWVTGRPTLLSGFFYFVALLAYLGATAPHRATPGKRWKAVSLAAFVAAVLSHPLAMSLPLTLLLLDAYPLRRTRLSWRQLLREKTPYVLVALIAAGLAMLARQQGVLWTAIASRDMETRLVSVGQSLWLYPATFIWPVALSPLYELPRRAELLNPRFLLPLLGSIVTLLVLVRYRRHFPGGLIAWIHMAVVVAPVSGLIHSGIQLGADRYAYQADIGFALLVGYGLTWALMLYGEGRLRRSIACAIAGTAIFVVVALGLGTWTYSGLWGDSETLWRWAVEVDGDCAVCNLNLSEAIVSAAAKQIPSAVAARAGEAEAYARKALALRPDLSDAHFNLGTVLAAQQRYDEAEVPLRAYVDRVPWDPAGPERLGLLRIAQGRHAEAVPFLRQAVALDPGSTMRRRHVEDVLRGQADLLERAGRHSEATRLREELTRLGTVEGGGRASSP